MSEAVKWYTLSAEAGHPRAQTDLGFLYYSGDGVERDFFKAHQLFRKAAARGSPRAQYGLGLQYEKGSGVEQSYVSAAVWYELAANKGFAPAQLMLGLLYQRGLGVDKDPVRTAMWLTTAWIFGEEAAQERAQRARALLTPAERDQAQRLHEEWANSHPELFAPE